MDGQTKAERSNTSNIFKLKNWEPGVLNTSKKLVLDRNNKIIITIIRPIIIIELCSL